MQTFYEAIVALFGFVPQEMDETLVIGKTETFLKNQSYFEAFLLATGEIKRRRSGDWLFSAISEATGCEITQEKINYLKVNYDETLVYKIIQENNTDDLFQKAVEIYVADFDPIKYPTQSAGITLFFLLKEKAEYLTSRQREFVEKILRFSSGIRSWPKHLQVILDTYIEYSSEETLKNNVTCIIKELSAIGETHILISLYWYYSYLGDVEVSESVLPFLASDEKKLEEIFKTYFPNVYCHIGVNEKNIEAKYRKVKTTKDVLGNISELIKPMGFDYLISVCLYTKSIGDREMEATFLCELIKKNYCRQLIRRMEDLSGFTISTDFKRLRLEDRVDWMSKRMASCRYVISPECKGWEKTNVDFCKEIYPLRPYNGEVIFTLLKMMSRDRFDDDLKKMFRYSIRNINSKELLCLLASRTIEENCTYAAYVLLDKMIELSGLIVAKDKFLKLIDLLITYIPTHNPMYKLIGKALDFYSKNMGEKNTKSGRYETLRTAYRKSVSVQ